MKQHTIQIATALALLASSAVHAQQAVQWRVEDGGNGHWYRRVPVTGGVGWAGAIAAAEAVHAHLVSITSASENAYLVANGAQGYDLLGASTPPDQGCSTSTWSWASGEPWEYTNWAPYEPSLHCQETVLVFSQAHFPKWNNFYGGSNGFWIEWDADCNADGVVDYGQLLTNQLADVNGNGVPDSCEFADCNSDGIADNDQTAHGQLPDYDANGVPDCCERGETCVTGNYPVQWKVSDGGNGHWYLFDQAVMHWQPHRDRAAALGGHLGTITSASEQTFVESVLFIQDADIWLGGVSNWPQPVAWITGEPVSFTYWQRYNPGGGYAFEMCGRSDCLLRFGWNIESENSDGWPGNKGLYEWDADCNSDNIVDYGQILQGQLADANTNGIPDICEGPTCHDIDLNLNGIVDGGDLGVLLAFWGTVSPAFPRADINGDGLVNGADLGTLLSFWGPCPN
jgi:hypothetical protein